MSDGKYAISTRIFQFPRGLTPKCSIPNNLRTMILSIPQRINGVHRMPAYVLVEVDFQFPRGLTSVPRMTTLNLLSAFQFPRGLTGGLQRERFPGLLRHFQFPRGLTKLYEMEIQVKHEETLSIPQRINIARQRNLTMSSSFCFQFPRGLTAGFSTSTAVALELPFNSLED